MAKLVRKGHRVAIAEQTSEPDGRRIVDREVTRVVTPGTVIEPALLESGANNYLASVAVAGAEAGIAYVDVTTGEFAVTELPRGGRRRGTGAARALGGPRRRVRGRRVRGVGGGLPPDAAARDELSRRTRPAGACWTTFGVRSLDAFGCEGRDLATAAAGAIIDYLGRTHRVMLPQLGALRTYSTAAFMTLDRQTRRNLELFEGGRWGAREQSLLRVLDLTETPMGARLLRRWLGQPLLDLAALERRLDAVAGLRESDVRRQRIRAELREVSDIERGAAADRRGRRVPPGTRRAVRLARAPPRSPGPDGGGRSRLAGRRPPALRRGGRSRACGHRRRSAGGGRTGQGGAGGLLRGDGRGALGRAGRAGLHRGARAEGARAHRHPRQGRLQPGLRLLPRGAERPTAPAFRTTTSADRPWSTPSASTPRS